MTVYIMYVGSTTFLFMYMLLQQGIGKKSHIWLSLVLGFFNRPVQRFSSPLLSPCGSRSYANEVDQVSVAVASRNYFCWAGVLQSLKPGDQTHLSNLPERLQAGPLEHTPHSFLAPSFHWRRTVCAAGDGNKQSYEWVFSIFGTHSAD